MLQKGALQYNLKILDTIISQCKKNQDKVFKSNGQIDGALIRGERDDEVICSTIKFYSPLGSNNLILEVINIAGCTKRALKSNG